MTSEKTEAPEIVSKKTVLIATGIALGVAVIVLVVAVLPAEYGVDPLGVGRLLGLNALARARPITRHAEAYKIDSLDFDLHPGEWLEYFVRLEEGESMQFSWLSTSPASYNFHSAPDGAPPGFAESFDATESSEAHGTYTAPFAGIHGWYWENPGNEDLFIKLSTTGFYSYVELSRERANGYRELVDAHGATIPRPER